MSKDNYKVVALAVSGKGNKIYRPGDIVSLNQINHPEEAISQRAIVLDNESLKSVSGMNTSELLEAYKEHSVSKEDMNEFIKLGVTDKKQVLSEVLIDNEASLLITEEEDLDNFLSLSLKDKKAEIQKLKK